jgi:hypothetical protein
LRSLSFLAATAAAVRDLTVPAIDEAECHAAPPRHATVVSTSARRTTAGRPTRIRSLHDHCAASD